MAELYDEKTLTPSDYTSYIRINKKQNDLFDRVVFNPRSKASRGEQFRDYVIERILHVDKDEQLKIARLDIVFDNAAMIDLLKRRGNAIKNDDHAVVVELEGEISKLKTKQYYTPIVGVFITFETDHDIRIAEELTRVQNLELF